MYEGKCYTLVTPQRSFATLKLDVCERTWKNSIFNLVGSLCVFSKGIFKHTDSTEKMSILLLLCLLIY